MPRGRVGRPQARAVEGAKRAWRRGGRRAPFGEDSTVDRGAGAGELELRSTRPAIWAGGAFVDRALELYVRGIGSEVE